MIMVLKGKGDHMYQERKSRWRYVLLGLVLCGFLMFLLAGVYSYRFIKSGDDSEISEMDGAAPIAVIEVSGVILDSKKIIESLMAAEKFKSIKAIIIRIDSPGGAVGPTQEIYEEIRRIDAIKPVYASFGSIAASGGYYIGAATRKIFANAGTLTGSIGVIMHFVDLSKVYEWAKVSQYSMKAGEYKDLGSPYRALTEAERKLMKEMLDEVHMQFKNDILKVREKRIIGDLNMLAQGQIFSGNQALKVGLVDEIGGLWEAGRKIHAELNLPEKFDLQFIKIKRKFSLMDFMENMDESLSNLKFGVALNRLPMLLYQP